MKNLFWCIFLLFIVGCGNDQISNSQQNQVIINEDNPIGEERIFEQITLQPNEQKYYFLDVITNVNIESNGNFYISVSNNLFGFYANEINLRGVEFADITIRNDSQYPITLTIDLRSF